MSGICGIIQTTEKETIVTEDLYKIHRWNYPYGLTCSDVFIDKNISLGCCLEHITNAPTPTKSVLCHEKKFAVIDAVLYNRNEITSKCPNTNSLSDEELLLTYISSYGYNILNDVNGDFSGAIYDSEFHTITLFRDHMGIRPLFYYTDNEILAFSTDIRGLLSFQHINPVINEDWLYRTLSGHAIIGTENTEFANIFCVPPSGYITFSCNSQISLIEKQKYWTIGQKKIRYSTTDKYINQLRELISDSVNRRLNVFPGLVGAELSGGLDSGIIDILINRTGRDAIYHSWSVAPELLPYAEDDERLIIADICTQENITCHYSGFSLNFGINSNIAKNTSHIKDRPLDPENIYSEYALPPYINTISICPTAEYINSQGAHVVFTGHGGDEGVSHRSNPYELFFHHEYYHFLKQMYHQSYGKNLRLLRMLKYAYKTVFIIGKKLKEPFIMDHATPELFQISFRNKMEHLPIPIQPFAFNPKKYVLDGGSRKRLDIVALLGALGGARYIAPYLDYRVIDYALSIPRHLYLKENTNRYIFREAFKTIIPDSLYRLTIKSNNSLKNIKPKEDWFERFKRGKEHLYNSLDWNYWKKYLDYNKITDWFNRGEPESEEEKAYDQNIMQNLNTCFIFQNLIVQVRGKL